MLSSQEEVFSAIDRRLQYFTDNRYRKQYPKARRPSDVMRRRYHYDKVTESLIESLGDHNYDCKGFRDKVVRLRNKHRKAFREYLEYVFNDDHHVGFAKTRARKSYREITFKTNSFRHCEVCGRIFYDLSRNGRTKRCHYEIAEKYDAGQSAIIRQFKDDRGAYTSTCEREAENAISRGSFNRRQHGNEYDGYKTYTASTRARKERELFTVYDPLAETDEERSALYALEAQMADDSGEFRDPQDIVCRTSTTHIVGNPPITPQAYHRYGTYEAKKLDPFLSSTRWVFGINIQTGERTVHDKGLYEELFDYRS